MFIFYKKLKEGELCSSLIDRVFCYITAIPLPEIIVTKKIVNLHIICNACAEEKFSKGYRYVSLDKR